MTTAEQNNLNTEEAVLLVEGRHAKAVTLQEPVKRGEVTIQTVHIRKPRSGELRGLSLPDLLNMKVDALMVVLPRITSPTLVKHEVENLDPADLVACGAAITRFLVQDAVMESLKE